MNDYYIDDDLSLPLADIIIKYNPKHILVIRGKKSYESCGAKKLLDEVLPRNISISYFFDFQDNPREEDLERGLSLLKSLNVDFFIAIGGGSVLDMGKLLRYYNNTKLPLVAIPTTAGTGSESTHFAVLYKNGIKHSVADPLMKPNYALIDYLFTINSPKYLTACSGFDALAQAIEAYWNVYATKESDEYALKAIKLLWCNLPLAVNAPTKDSRRKVAEGSFWAGKAINITKTTAPHACAYPFTIHYGYPHGHAVALTFPFWAEFNLSDAGSLSQKITEEKVFKRKMESLINILSVGVNIKDAFISYIRNIDLEVKLHNVDNAIIREGINIDRLSNNPKRVTPDVIKLLLEYLCK